MTNWQTKRSDSAGTETLALKRVVFWDPEEPTATRPLAINVLGDNLYFPTVDLTKNVCELVDFYGDVAATYDYAPFGAVSAGTPSGSAAPANPFQWSSEVYDDELGLVYYNYRHYSPTDGRFLSRDPIEEQGGWNLYAFLKNSPLRKVDLLGTEEKLNSCVNISFTVSKSFAGKQVQVFPFLFINISGSLNFSANGKLCKSCCNGKSIDAYEIGAAVSGDATLTATAGFAFKEDVDGIFSANVWGGVQAYGGAELYGSGSFSKDCSGSHGKGVGILKGTAGLRVGAEVNFSVGQWTLGTTGVSGGGKSVVSLPFNFVCTERDCGNLSWGEGENDSSLFLNACAFGVCFEKEF